MRRFGIAALLAALVLSGCGIPDNSPVRQVAPGPSTGTSSGDAVTPTIPRREDAVSPSSLVQNYLLAAAGSPVDAPARVKGFLSPAMAAGFKPQLTVRVIHPVERPLNNPGSNEVSIRGRLVGTLDDNGVLQLVLVAEYTRQDNGKPHCTQSWNVSGVRGKAATVEQKPAEKAKPKSLFGFMPSSVDD